MEVECYRIKLKPGSRDTVLNWAEHLTKHAEEVRSLIQSEGIAIESAFLETIGDEDYLIYYLRGENLKRASEIARASTHPIDVFHREVMRSVSESGAPLRKLIDFST
jgi:hypothetical protein